MPDRPSTSRHSVEATVTARIEMTPRVLAEAFAEMSDEGQAQFFIEVADVARGWGVHPHAQWYLAGRHLATCKCSTDEARELVATIARGAAAGPG